MTHVETSHSSPPTTASAQSAGIITRLGSLVKIEHSVFALPFAALGMLLGADGLPQIGTVLLILLALISARTAAMSFNRIVDHRLDSENPRTAERELPSGALQRPQALALVIISSALFVGAAFLLRPLCGWLSFPTLFLILGYSYTKRFTALSHLILGLALGISPGAAWLAVGAPLSMTPIILGFIVMLWVAGFDILYSLADIDFDRTRGLHSVPGKFGAESALWLSRTSHALSFIAMVYLYVHLTFPLWTLLTLAPTLILFIRQHMLVSVDDFSRLNAAFFAMNGWIGFLFCGAVAAVWYA